MSDSESTSYLPTNDELEDEVAEIILEYFTPSPRDILEKLQRHKPEWTVPEQRIAKYMEVYGDLRRGIHKQETSTESQVPPKPPRRTFSAEKDVSSGSDDSADDEDETELDVEDNDEGETSHNNSYSESFVDDDDDEDAQEFVEEVARRSKFIAQGGTHSLKKVLNGEARAGTSGPARLDRRRIFRGTTDETPTASREPPKTPLRNISIDSTDSQIEEEADRRSLFMLKGASHSIRKLLMGETKNADKALDKAEQRKMHFKKGSNAVHYTEKPHLKPEEINKARLEADAQTRNKLAERKAAAKRAMTLPKRAPRPAAMTVQPEVDEDPSSVHADDDDEALEAEADRRSLMLKGASHSIRNLFSGNTKKDSSGLNRFNRRKSSLLKDANAVHYAEKPHLKPAEINARHKEEAERLRRQSFTVNGDDNDKNDNLDVGDEVSKEAIDERIDQLHGDSDGGDDDELDDADIEAEANRRSNFMAKGGSYSIQKVLKGEARAKQGVSRFDRRKMHFQKEAHAIHSHDQDNARVEEPSENPSEPTESEEIVFSNDNNSNSELFGDQDEQDDIDDKDREIEAEADRRSNFMAKGGSYSIQKVLKGEARAKKGITRFDRRRMHFKKESEAIHSHDHDGEMAKAAPNDHSARLPTRKASTEEINSGNDDNDSDEDFTEEDAELLAEVDSRQMMMLKGASHSIRNLLSGNTKMHHDEGTALDRRTSRLRNASITKTESKKKGPVASPESEAEPEPEVVHDDPSESVNDDDAGLDFRQRFSLKGASHSIRNLLSGKTGMSSSQFDAEIGRLQGDMKDDDSEVKGDEDREIEEEADRRSTFMARGGSYSITKVLSGNAGKKTSGITRFDRRKMHFKNESKAINSHGSDGREEEEGNGPEDDADKDTDEKFTIDDDDDEGGDDAEIEEEADRRSNFILKGASYSIQKVLSGNARKPKNVTVSRFDRRKMHFARKDSGSNGPADDVQPVANPRPPSRGMNDEGGDDNDDNDDKDGSEYDDEDAELLAQANDRTMMMLKGASHSIRNLFSGNTKMHQDEGSGFNRRLSRLKQSPRSSKTSAEMTSSVEQAEAAHGGSEETAMDSPGPKENPDDNDDEDEDEEIDFRKRFSLKGASHSIKKVLAGTARSTRNSTPTAVTRLDRRKMAFRRPSSGDAAESS